MKKIALVISMLFFYTDSVLALECKALNNGGHDYRETYPVSEVLIPKDSKDGEKIWISELFDRSVECDSKISEKVFFYPFPEVDSSTIPNGMVFGITYQGKDYDLTAGTERIETDIFVNGNTVRSNIAVQLYIKKKGNIDAGRFLGKLDIYQLDGKGGLNNDLRGPNFRFSLSQLNNITEITCDFGYSWHNFNIDINNDLTLRSQKVSNIGNLNLTCHADNNIDLKNKRVTLDIYPDSTKSGEAFTTNLDALNFIFNIDGQELKPRDKKQITVQLVGDGDKKYTSIIEVDGLFKLNYQEPGPNWLYDPATSTVMPEKVNVKADLKLIE